MCRSYDKLCVINIILTSVYLLVFCELASIFKFVDPDLSGRAF